MPCYNAKQSARISIIIGIILSLSVITGCARDFVTGKKTYNIYSIDSDVKLGQYVMKLQLKALKDNKKEYDSKKNKKQLKLIKEIVKDIAEVSHYPKFPYEVHLADMDIVNAWCAPGGKMMVYEGLWDPKKGLLQKKDKDELAFVLAHEIAHATARHVTETLSMNMTILAVGQIAANLISTSSVQGANLFQRIFVQGMNIFIPTYSRKNEYEADRVGLIYMAKAGYDPRVAVKLWKRVAKKKGDQTSIFATHPASGARAKQLMKYLPEALEYYERAKAEKPRSGRRKKRQ